MARITVEDCLSKVQNRFELVLVASRRARQLAMGGQALVPWENDKPTVVALREIAEDKVDPAALLRQIEARNESLNLGATKEAEPEAAAMPPAAPPEEISSGDEATAPGSDEATAPNDNEAT